MLNPVSTLVIILGVSVCPRAPNFQPLQQCANSAKDFEDYLRAFGVKNIINCFNSEASASDQIDQIEDWLSQRMRSVPAPTDLIVYYTGHGGFSRNDQSYFLAVHRTREGAEGATSIRYVDLASSIKRHTNELRKYLILDCCFAAAAVLKIQADLTQLVVDRVQDELPPSGTAVLCSSAAKLVSIAPPGEKYTMFSGALLACLKSGVPDAPSGLTLEHIGLGVRKLIQDKYPNEAVRPELHVPEQSHGNLARMPLFPNAWAPQPQSQSASDLPLPVSTNLLSPSDHWVGIALRTIPVRMLIGSFCGIASAATCAFLNDPWGLSNGIKDASLLAPLGPALCLSIGLTLVIPALSVFRWASIVFIPLATFFAWQIAWVVEYYSVEFLDGSTWVHSAALDIASGIAGVIGAFTLNISLIGFLQGRNVLSSRRGFQSASRALALFGLICAIAVLPGMFRLASLLSLSITLGAFVLWQGWYISTLPVLAGREKDLPRRSQAQWLGFSVVLVGLLALSPIRNWLNTLLENVQPLELRVEKVSTKPSSNDQSAMTINYGVVNNTRGKLSCKLNLQSNGAQYSDQDSTDLNPSGSIVKYSTFTVPKQGLSQSNAQVRLNCSGYGIGYLTDWQDLDRSSN